MRPRPADPTPPPAPSGPRGRVVTPFGDAAYSVETMDTSGAHRMAAAVGRACQAGSAPPGIDEVVVGFRSVVVHVDLQQGDVAMIGTWLEHLPVADLAEGGATRQALDIPVVFDGPDLTEVADQLGLSSTEVVALAVGVDLQVAFVGFSPGFPYLVGLPEALTGVRRRSTPRTSVPAGSVAVAGGFAGIYPQPTPGGWMLLGHTELVLFDPETPPYAALRPGDVVRFRPVSPSVRPVRTALPVDVPPAGREPGAGAHEPGAVAAEAEAEAAEAEPGAGARPVGHSSPPESRPPLRARRQRFVRVVEPGMLTLVHDAGRVGMAAIGVPRAGPADPDTMRLANELVGNADDAPALEITARGPILVFTDDEHVAVVGSTPNGGTGEVDVTVDGRPVSANAVVPVKAGQALVVGRPRHGLRATIAVAGGLASPAMVGSRSSDLLSGLGIGPLVAGDQLELGRPGRPRGFLLPAEPELSTRPEPPAAPEGPAPEGPATPEPDGDGDGDGDGPGHQPGEPEDDERSEVRATAATDAAAPSEAPVAVAPRPPATCVARVTAGPHPFLPGEVERLLAVTWVVGPASNRVGLRLAPTSGAAPLQSSSLGILSTGMVTGALQVPPDGEPILLMPDHATVGGYPVIACVTSADLARLGQLAPGDTIRFEQVDRAGALDRWTAHERALDRRVSGWFPVTAGT